MASLIYQGHEFKVLPWGVNIIFIGWSLSWPGHLMILEGLACWLTLCILEKIICNSTNSVQISFIETLKLIVFSWTIWWCYWQNVLMINEKNNFLTVSWLSGLLSAEIFISTGEWGVQMPPLTSENSYFLRSGPQGATLVMKWHQRTHLNGNFLLHSIRRQMSGDSDGIIRRFEKIIRHFILSIYEKVFRWSDNLSDDFEYISRHFAESMGNVWRADGFSWTLHSKFEIYHLASNKFQAFMVPANQDR